MKRELKCGKDERPREWLDRICEYIEMHEVSKKEMREILQEVSTQGYINGTNDAKKVYGGVWRSWQK